jgi:hypothetical protein
MRLTKWILILVPVFFTCDTPNPASKNKGNDSTQTQLGTMPADKTQMAHFTSIYQAWTEDGTIHDTLNFVHIWYDGQFIIIEDTTQHEHPKFTLEIGQEVPQPNLEKYQQLGGVDPQTTYSLKKNDLSYHQLTVFKSNNDIVKQDIKYKHTFTLHGSVQTKIYFSYPYIESSYKKINR